MVLFQIKYNLSPEMKIYRIVNDVEKYQWIMPQNEKDLFDALSFDCFPKKESWNPIEMYIFNSKKKKGNFYSLGGIGALVFDDNVLNVMRTFFEMAGEILPVFLNGTELYILNVLECVNALDEKKTIWNYYENQTRDGILKYAFHNKRFTESSIFKIPETSKTEILTYSGFKDPIEEFYSLYIQYAFEGLLFDQIA